MGLCQSKPLDYDGEVNFDHFKIIRSIGKGAFGKVSVVRHKQTQQDFALKYMDKQACVEKKSVANIVRERRLLEEIEHPFVVNLHYAFQDDVNCYFVLDLMLGGDLRFHLHRGPMPEDAVRFMVAELCCALWWLHDKQIIHRDIKPDNILLDGDGHAHLTDFNVATRFSERKPLTSVAGSMAYMAPEIHTKKGYSWQVDFWSLGVSAYELLYGRRPFRSPARGSSDSTANLAFPAGSSNVKVSAEAQSALRMFLEVDPNRRLGCAPHGEGAEDIRRHPWFRGIDWNLLERKALNPPFVPDGKKDNYDPTHQLEEVLLATNPLRHTKIDPKRDTSKLGSDMRALEEHFTVYDVRRMGRHSHGTDQLATSMTGTSSGVDSSRPGTPAPTFDRMGTDNPMPRIADSSSYHGHSQHGHSQQQIQQMHHMQQMHSSSTADLQLVHSASHHSQKYARDERYYNGHSPHQAHPGPPRMDSLRA